MGKVLIKLLKNGHILVVSSDEDGTFYKADVYPDIKNLNFEDVRGIIHWDETIETIALQLESWIEDNINHGEPDAANSPQGSGGEK